MKLSVMVIGEAPGAEEIKRGEPFVGRSGKKLDQWLQELNLKREDIYITNLIKKKLPNNRKPTKEEITYFLPKLIKEIEDKDPHLIIALGCTVTETFAGWKCNMKKDVGSMFYTMMSKGYRVRVIPMYHPSYIMRFGKKSDERYALNQLKMWINLYFG